MAKSDKTDKAAVRETYKGREIVIHASEARARAAEERPAPSQRW